MKKINIRLKQMSILSLLPIVLLLLSLVFTSNLVSKEIKTVIASGYGTTEKNAVNSALVNALEQVVGVYLESENYVENYITIEDKILSKTEGYIDSYKILRTEDDTENNVVAVTIRAKVIRENLEEDLKLLGLLSKQMDMPRVMLVFFSENEEFYLKNKSNQKIIDKFYYGITEVLSQRGIFVIDKSTMVDFYKEQKDISFSELSNRIADYGLKVNADFIIRYDLHIAKDGSVVYSDAELISSSTSKIFASVSELKECGNYDKENEVLNKMLISRSLGKDIGKKLLSKIMLAWEDLVENGKYFTLVLEGYVSYSKVLNFEKYLLKIKNNISELREIESGDNKSTILLRYKGSRNNLKQEIFSVFKMNKWAVRLLRSESSRMSIKILK